MNTEDSSSLCGFVVVQSLSCVWLFVAPWIATCQAPLSFNISSCLLGFMPIEPMMLCNHFIFSCSLLLLPSIFPSIRVFSNESVLRIRWSNIGASASESVLPMNIQGWFPLELNGLISLQSRELSRVLSSTTIWKHQFFFIFQPFVVPQAMLFNLVHQTMQMYVIISEG